MEGNFLICYLGITSGGTRPSDYQLGMA